MAILFLASPLHAATLQKTSDNQCVALVAEIGGDWVSSAWWDDKTRWTALVNNPYYQVDVSLDQQVSNTETATYVSLRAYGWTGSSWTNSAGSYGAGNPILGQRVSQAVKNQLIANFGTVHPNTSHPTGPGANCGVNPCAAKAGQSNYKLDVRNEGTPANLGDSCYEDCKTTAEELWEDCLNDQCVSSIKHTYTGDECNGQPAITDLDPQQPDRCTEELNAKIAACGGSLNVQSFNFETCTGVCAPDDCHSAWLSKVNECGGIMAVSSWDNETCTGHCASDYAPTNENPPDGVSPTEVTSGETLNPDGTRIETQTTTYNYNGTTYNETTTTTYDGQGNVTGTTTKTTEQPGSYSNPEMPGDLNLDPSVGDAKNWTEYDDTQAIGTARANKKIQEMQQNQTEMPFNITINTNGAVPYLSGPMFGREVQIRFDRPWMLTGYSIMKGLLISIGYLQAFLMVHRVYTGA